MGDLFQSASALATAMFIRDRPPLTAVDIAALLALPGVPQERLHAYEIMPHSNAQPVPIHHCHHPVEARAVTRPLPQNLMLPLMNHLVRQRPDNFCDRLVGK